MSSPEVNIGVVGATGLVGQKMLDVLASSELAIQNLRVFASERSVGSEIGWQDHTLIVEDAWKSDYSDLDVVLFSAGGDVSIELAPTVAGQGPVVVDNSSAWRSDDDVPLIVSNVNDREINQAYKNIIAVPNCNVGITLTALGPLDAEFGLESTSVVSYQAISGMGASALKEFNRQSLMDASLIDKTHNKSYRRIKPKGEFVNMAYNLTHLPAEATKIEEETKKILNLPDLAIGAESYRVPVPNGHTMIVSAGFSSEVSPNEAMQIFEQSPGVENHSNPNPYDASGRYDVLAGCIKRDQSRKNGLLFTVSGDNLLRGAALMAVQIAALEVAD